MSLFFIENYQNSHISLKNQTPKLSHRKGADLRFPIIGWHDEVASLAVLVQKMSKYITHEMEGRADAKPDKWFPEYAKYGMIEE